MFPYGVKYIHVLGLSLQGDSRELVLHFHELGGLLKNRFFFLNVVKIAATEAKIVWLLAPMGFASKTLDPTFPMMQLSFITFLPDKRSHLVNSSL